jgi:hypothetical protein
MAWSKAFNKSDTEDVMVMNPAYIYDVIWLEAQTH